MEHFEIFNISNHYHIDDTKNLLHLLHGSWYPQDTDTQPIKMNLTSLDASDFICQSIDSVHHNILLHHKVNPSIVLDIHVVHSNQIILNIKNVDALGVSPKMTFIKQ